MIRSLGLVAAGALAVAIPVGHSVRKNVLKAVEYVYTVDGDTVVVDLPTLPPLFGEALPVRIAHIDTPELKSEEPCAAELALEASAETEKVVSKAKQIELIEPKRDSFFRIIADIKINGHLLLSKHLLEKNLAVPYEGGAKPSVDWCSLKR